MKKLILVSTLSIVFVQMFNLETQIVNACTPIIRTPEELFASSTIIARGTVVEFISATSTNSNGYLVIDNTAKLDINTYWKGNVGKDITIKSRNTPGYTCGPVFGENINGKDIIVYGTGTGNTFYVGWADFRIVDKKVLKELGKGYDPIETATVTPTPIAFKFNRNLTVGYSGEDVIELQTKLEYLGYLKIPQGTSKGFFGQLTRKALAEYQKANGIVPAVGYFGPITRQILNK